MAVETSTDGAALVTGASRGIGRELVELFAADGWNVVLVSRSEDRLREVGETLTERHSVEATVVPADLSEPESAREVYEEVTERGLVVDALVNNAGFGVYGEFLDTDLDSELDVIGLHVVTVTVLTKLFGRDMAERGHGYVLNNASTAGWVPVPQSAVYSAAKHYERSLAEALARELEDHGVTVTALCPGETDTDFFDRGNYDESSFEAEDMMDPATVARAGYQGLMDGERVVVPGALNKFRVGVRRILPRETYIRAADRAQNE